MDRVNEDINRRLHFFDEDQLQIKESIINGFGYGQNYYQSDGIKEVNGWTATDEWKRIKYDIYGKIMVSGKSGRRTKEVIHLDMKDADNELEKFLIQDLRYILHLFLQIIQT